MRLSMPIPFGQFASFTELLAWYSSTAFGPGLALVVEVVQRLQMNESKSLMKIQFQVAVVLLI